MKRLLVSSLGLLALTGFVAWAALDVSAATRNVSVVDDAYTDAVSMNSTTTINLGDTVQWNWSGSNQHTVSSNSAEVFDSGGPQTSGSFSHTFNTVGSFAYICGVHGTAMTGTVVVQAAQAPTNTPQATNTTGAATNTPSGSATNTPAATAAAPTNPPGTANPASTPAAGTAAPSGTQSAGGALPTTGTGGGSDGFPWAMVTALVSLAGLALVSVAAYRVFRPPAQ